MGGGGWMEGSRDGDGMDLDNENTEWGIEGKEYRWKVG